MLNLAQKYRHPETWPCTPGWIVESVAESTVLPGHVFLVGRNMDENGATFSWTVPLPLSWRYVLPESY